MIRKKDIPELKNLIKRLERKFGNSNKEENFKGFPRQDEDDSWAKEVEDMLDRKYPERRCRRRKRSPWDDFDIEALPPWWFYD